jgi:hypothetical protein
MGAKMLHQLAATNINKTKQEKIQTNATIKAAFFPKS